MRWAVGIREADPRPFSHVSSTIASLQRAFEREPRINRRSPTAKKLEMGTSAGTLTGTFGPIRKEVFALPCLADAPRESGAAGQETTQDETQDL
jgi:hypothetical protein